MSPSSTSSSEPNASEPVARAGWRRWELWLACALAAAIVFALDASVFSSPATWQRLSQRVGMPEAPCGVEQGKADSMLALSRLAAQDDKARGIVVGSSRACEGWKPDGIPTLGDRDPRNRMRFAKVAFAVLGPYAMRSLATQVEDVDRVVIYLSEFDTHRPPFLLPGVGFGGVRALVEFLPSGSSSFWWDQRTTLLQLSTAAVLDGYRHRDVLFRAAGEKARRFPLDDRFPSRGSRLNALIPAGAPPGLLSGADFERAVEEIGAANPLPIPLSEFYQIHSIARGAHAELQMALVEAAVREFAEKGAEVLLVEAPLSPLGDRLFDTTIRADFLAFVDRLRSRYSLDFLSREDQPAFQLESFTDLTHLYPEAAQELTRSILRRLSS